MVNIKTIAFYIFKFILENFTFVWDLTFFNEYEDKRYELTYMVFAKSFKDAKKYICNQYDFNESSFKIGGGTILGRNLPHILVSVKEVNK